MGTVTGIPSTRISEMFISQRLMNQVHSSYLDMFRAQLQLSTGQRIQLPSEDPHSAERIVSLQGLLERQQQFQTNLATGQSYLTATDTALAHVYDDIVEARGIALGAIETIATDAQRAAAVQQVQQAVDLLLKAGNQRIRGRYLFAGSDPGLKPFVRGDTKHVEYRGNEETLSSYFGIDLPFGTNLHGSEVFGAISEPVVSTVDFNPVLTYDTRLADLRGGRGITDGSIEISVADGSGNPPSIIDLGNAETIGDVAAMIRANPPAGRELYVEIAHAGLVIEDSQGLPITIKEVGAGTTAEELGILADSGVVTRVVGTDLDPVLRQTTRVDDVLGTRAYTVVRSDGSDNDLIFEATSAGAAANGIEVRLVDDGSVLFAGIDEVASFAGGVLTVTIKAGETQARHVLAAVEAAAIAEVTARLDPLDDQNGGLGYVAQTDPLTPPVLQGGSGSPLDKDAGLQIVNRQETHIFSFSDAETIEDLLNTLNTPDAGLLAEINEHAAGINVRSRVSGCDFMIGENGGLTATQLGLRTFTRDTRLEDLNFGLGVETYPGPDFTITLADGALLYVDVSGTNDGSGYVTTTPSEDPPVMTGGDVTAQASVTVQFTGSDNDLTFTAQAPGGAMTGTRIVFNEVPGGPIAFRHDVVAKTLTVDFDPGVSTAQDIVDALAVDPLAADFAASLVPDQSLEDIGEVLDVINALAPGLLEARLAAYGNGIELVDTSVGGDTLTVTRSRMSAAANMLGLIPEGADTSDPPVVNPGSQVLTGRDVRPLETEGIFTALMRLGAALEADDVEEAERAMAILDDAMLSLSFSRAGLGVHQQTLDVMQMRAEDDKLLMQTVLSDEFDADLTEAISVFTSRQIAFEAALRSASSILEISLLNYI